MVNAILGKVDSVARGGVLTDVDGTVIQDGTERLPWYGVSECGHLRLWKSVRVLFLTFFGRWLEFNLAGRNHL